MSRKNLLISWWLVMTFCLVADTTALLAVQGPGGAQAVSSPTGTIVTPDRFLRRWDPVTIFFAKDLGPTKPGPEDQAHKFVTMTPPHPGAYFWLDAHTLQFRPAEPWPPLGQVRLTVEDKAVTLPTLMEAPESTLPADQAEGLEPIEEIGLVFAEPLDPAALARIVSVELRPLPGIDGRGARWLSAKDFQVKSLERLSRADKAGYVLTLRHPIPLGTRVLVHFRLALDDTQSDAFKEVSFSTGEPFRIQSVGCGSSYYPITPTGSSYTREQPLNCGSDSRLVLNLSAPLGAINPTVARNLVRFSPAVEDLSFSTSGKTLEIRGRFIQETLYQLNLAPAEITDARGRPLDLTSGSQLYFHFPRQTPYLTWTSNSGIAERFGPKSVPVAGRGHPRADLRIYRIDPLDLSFWPFPDDRVVVDESLRPPGPGEEPAPVTAPAATVESSSLVRRVLGDRPAPLSAPMATVDSSYLTRRIPTLGTPLVSRLVNLPLRREGSAANFGLDLKPYLSELSAEQTPGTYLVGLRDLTGSTRQWMRIQVTDLCLTTSEEATAVKFFVTSLSSGQPVAGATVRVEGTVQESGIPKWVTLTEGTTDVSGSYRWNAPGHDPTGRRTWRVKRLVVLKETDVLVLDPDKPPEVYADNQWSEEGEPWLRWVYAPLGGRAAQAEVLCHIFTERPVYRPEEEVHIKGYLRRREQGRLVPVKGEGWVVVTGPGDLAWKYPVTLTEAGSFYHRFSEKELPTGTFRAHFENRERTSSYGEVAFEMQAYRIPRFEITIHAPDQASLDREFEVSLTASYYAGGRVAGRPVEWRVTQFPYPWTPRKREGFVYSSDGRYSGVDTFQASPRLEKQDVTDESGAASLVLNPAIEPTAQPRTYAVEVTVTGDDDQTVSASKSITAAPPFVLGLKAPRYLEKAVAVEPEVLVAAPDGSLIADKEVTVRLFRREWHSHLRASDFSDGVARYMTDIVDEKISETKIQSASEPLPVRLPIDQAGVYIVEIEAHDRLNRAQVVRVDLYAGGDQPVTWPKPITRVFSVSTDQPRYDPGQTATLVLRSPFQNAYALAIVEAPEGNRYEWIGVEGGKATYQLPIQGHFNPRIPVHFILMRGRIPGTAPVPGNATDLGKPATMAATAWVEVNPVAYQAAVELKYPDTARPGQKVDVAIALKDPQGKPLAGEVTLWLVDQAVLALGKEQRLDPVPDFVRPVRSRVSVHDTRNLAFGALAFEENPGGDTGEEGESLLERATVRKNFKTVPYYNPAIAVGPDGKVVVPVQLSDDLTNFKVRAKAACGPERFGVGTGKIEVRLPVIVQPALPRFVRPGDQFVATAIGRIVQGEGGPGQAELQAKGLELSGPTTQALTWQPGKPERIEFPAQAQTPAYSAEGQPSWDSISLKVGVIRSSDQASDAFEVELPIRRDRDKVSARFIQDLKPGEPLVVPAIKEGARPGTIVKSVLVTDQPSLLRLVAGLDFFMEYPYGCTEQQVSRARAFVAMRRLMTVLKQRDIDKRSDRAVRDAIQFVSTTVDRNGLIAYWPGSTGYVSLTAWTTQFLLEAKAAGFPVDDKLLGRLSRTLEQALRSDYSQFISGEALTERCWALAALAQAGRFNSAYAAELARRAQFLGLEGLAEVLAAFALSGNAPPAVVDSLVQELSQGVATRLYQGREVYAGLQDRAITHSDLILPSETRTLAEITRAVARTRPKHPRLPLMVDALTTLGRGDGWGSTNANAAAMLALAEVAQPVAAGSTAAQQVRIRVDGKEQTVGVGAQQPIVSVVGTQAQEGEVLLQGAAGARTVAARVEVSYLPAAPGSMAAAVTQGFVVSREALIVSKTGGPPRRLPLDNPGTEIALAVGDVVEEHVQVVNPKARNHVAITIPLAAGCEPLNPKLATAPPEATPSGRVTEPPSYVGFMDDYVGFYYDSLPAGTYDFYFRTRAAVPGVFTQPPAKAEMMYDANAWGGSPGAKVLVKRGE